MNNPRLLAGLLSAVTLSTTVRADIITLDSIFETAEYNSVQLKPSLSAETEAASALTEARLRRLPDINTTLSLSYIGDGFTTGRDFSDYQRAPIPHFGNTFSVNISQPLYAGGAISASIQLADLKLTATRYSTELNRDNIRFQLAGYYLDIYKYYNLRTVVVQNIDNAREVLREMNIRYDRGTVLQNDITRYELLVSNLELELVNIENCLAILNNNLVSIAGLPSGTTVEPDTTILDRSLPLSPESEWLTIALENSPTLKLARRDVDICRKKVDVVRADYRPKIGLQAGWCTEGPILVEVPPINRNLSYWHAGITVSYNISSLFKTDKTVRRAEASAATAIDRLEARMQNISVAIHADYIHYLEAYETLKVRTKSVELAECNYRTVSTRYAAGMALVTEMVDASNTLLEARQLLVNSRIDIIYYYYKLLFITGQI